MEITQQQLLSLLAPIVIPHSINPEFSIQVKENGEPDFSKDFRVILASEEFVYAYLMVFVEENFIFLMEASQGKSLYKGSSMEEACKLLKEGLGNSPTPNLPN